MIPAPDFTSAVAAFNAAHPGEWPRSDGKCPACGHERCFGALPRDPSRWFCHSTSHEADSKGCGRRGNGGFYGDALDLTAHAAGLSRVEVLRREGLLTPPTSNGEAKPVRTIVSTTEYPIRDVAGSVVAVHVRRDLSDGDKSFAWTRNGKSNLGGFPVADLPLYGVEDLRVASKTAAVVIVEGEKARDALRARRILSLGTVTGAGHGKAPSRAALEPLRGRDVVLWPDNDEAGEDHAAALARNLEGIAASVRVFRWASAPPKGDAADWRGTREELRAALVSAPAWSPKPVTTTTEDGARHVASRPLVVRLADVEKEEVRWLWFPRIPRRYLTLLEGDPGLGKSYLTTRLVAVVTRGEPMPDTAGPALPPRNVLIMTAEDGLGDTVRPRLESAGADLRRVYAVTGTVAPDPRDPKREREFALTLSDVDALGAAMQDHAPALVVIDPIQAYLGSGVDAHRANEVRPILAGVARLAHDHDAAVVIVRHLAKATGGSRLVYRGLGSIDFAGAARSILHVAAHPADREDRGRRVVVHGKSNLVAKAQTLGFTLDATGWTWTGVADVGEGDVRDADGDSRGGRRGPAPSKRREAEDFLRDALANGAAPKQRVLALGEDAGYSERTLERAAAALEVVRTWGGPGRHATWALPPPADPFAKCLESEKPGEKAEGKNQASGGTGGPSAKFPNPMGVGAPGGPCSCAECGSRDPFRGREEGCRECDRRYLSERLDGSAGR